jgi:hypothetical protein
MMGAGRTMASTVSGTRGAALMLALLWSNSARAYRPFDGTDAAVAKDGEAEIEIGPGYLVEAGSRSIVAPRAVLNLGVFPRWELVLEGIGLFPFDSNGSSTRFRLDDTAVSLKAILREGGLQKAWGPSIATEGGVLLPTVNAEPGVGAALALIVSQQWDFLTFHANGQVLRTRARRLGLFGGLILEGPGRWPVRPVAEGFLASETAMPTTASGLLGAIWRVNDKLCFDAGFQVVRRGTLDNYEGRVGLTWDLELWGEK